MKKLKEEDRVYIRKLLAEGLTSKQIHRKHKKYRTQQIAGVAAWGTMRKPGWRPRHGGMPKRLRQAVPESTGVPLPVIPSGKVPVVILFDANDPRLQKLFSA